jgi:hypothetical protein
MGLTMKTIFITIEAKPQIASVIRASTWVTVKDRRYEDTGLGGWTGFYDWLRPKVSEVIGLRFSPFEEAQNFWEPLKASICSLEDRGFSLRNFPAIKILKRYGFLQVRMEDLVFWWATLR